MSSPKSPASALSALPTAKAAIKAISRPRRGSRAPRKASTGAPTTTPTAYAEMTLPAAGIETSTPSAICGSRPIVTNSVVPIANPPMARASTASPKWAGLVAVSAGVVVDMLIAFSNRARRFTYSSTPEAVARDPRPHVLELAP